MKTAWYASLAVALAWTLVPAAGATDSVCAKVVIAIAQELTLERQGFDAHMRISNDSTMPLSEVDIDVLFTDAQGNLVVGTSDTSQTNAHFYIRVDSLSQINNVDGAGAIAAGVAADIHWLIIPAPGAGGTSPGGLRYYVGAILKYKQGGEEVVREVVPDSILVKPMPELQLDYFLTENVYADDAFTEWVEPSVPFPLGVRIKNAGAGTAQALKIRAAQPQIVDNEQGLLIGFEIIGSEVAGQPAGPSLLADFGSIAPAKAKTARWMMTCTLSGKFVDFNAYYKHADELGGELTSLIKGINTHLLVHDVLVDLPGRDGARDFLVRRTNGVLELYESDAVDTVVSNLSEQATVRSLGRTNRYENLLFTIPPAAGGLYAQVAFPERPLRDILQVIRRVDGKVMSLANVWQYKERQKDDKAKWDGYLALFDVNGGGDYEIRTSIREELNLPPLLNYIGSKTVREGEMLSFLAQAADPNYDTLSLSAMAMPVGAVFTNLGNGRGQFHWATHAGDYGVHPIRVEVSDGVLTDWEIVKLYVGRPGEALDADGIPVSLQPWHVPIEDLLASSACGMATVQWVSVDGLYYDVYLSDDPFQAEMSWNVLGPPIYGTGVLQDAVDENLGTNRNLRFYQVALGGHAPGTNGVWGVIRRTALGASYTMMAPPLRMDRRFNGALGQALGEQLTGADDASGDRLFAFQEEAGWYTLYMDTNMVWRDTNGQQTVYELPAGRGFWIERRTDTAARVTFTGPVGNNEIVATVVQPGWNILSLSAGLARSLEETFGGAQPMGAASEEEADQIVIQTPAGVWRRLMYVNGWNSPYDGRWFDLSTFHVFTNKLEPGAAYYYYRQPDAGSLDVQY